MKKFLLASLVFLIPFIGVKAQSSNFSKDRPFQVGEELTYSFKYGMIKVAEGILLVQETDKSFNGNKAIHISAVGRTATFWDNFMRVRNRYDSYVDPVSLKPYYFTENVREGKMYKRDSYASFDHKNKKVKSTKGDFDITANTMDMISMFYFARAKDLSGMKVGDKIELDYFLDDGVYPMQVEFLGIETIRTPIGKVECLKYKPSIEEGRAFRKDSNMFMWVTNDRNKIPVRVEVEIQVGSLRMDLTKYSNLKYPVEAKR